ncbi:MAG TPA: hypothetical protein PLR39_05420 [Treponemataceae bacterium]|nr:hypothetical protein [Treponemataceae bacterium]
MELVKSGFDFFAGGAFMDPTDKNKDKESIYDLAKKAGYTVAPFTAVFASLIMVKR